MFPRIHFISNKVVLSTVVLNLAHALGQSSQDPWG